MERIRESVSFRIGLFVTGPIVAAVLSFLGSFFEIFRRATYIPTRDYQPDWHVIFWFCVWAILTAYFLIVTILGISTKESEIFRSKKLEAELTTEKTASSSFEKQRNLLVRITKFARQAVTRKTERLGNIDVGSGLTVEHYFDQLNPVWQLQFLLNMIHEFFKPEDPNINFRLGLWTAVGDHLAPLYSWDGEKSNCFSCRSKDYMKVFHITGPISEISKSYLGNNENVRIIPDCDQAAANGQFQYLYPNQSKKVRSMVLYKYVFMRRREPMAVVVLLVSSQPNHFRLYTADEIKQFLDEILMRIEMEWVMITVKEKLTQAGRGAL